MRLPEPQIPPGQVLPAVRLIVIAPSPATTLATSPGVVASTPPVATFAAIVMITRFATRMRSSPLEAASVLGRPRSGSPDTSAAHEFVIKLPDDVVSDAIRSKGSERESLGSLCFPIDDDLQVRRRKAPLLQLPTQLLLGNVVRNVSQKHSGISLTQDSSSICGRSPQKSRMTTMLVVHSYAGPGHGLGQVKTPEEKKEATRQAFITGIASGVGTAVGAGVAAYFLTKWGIRKLERKL